MSSRKPAVAKPARTTKPAARAVAKRTARPAAVKTAPVKLAAASDLSASAVALAAELKRSVAAGQLDALPPEALQALMSAATRLYAAQVEAGQQYLPVAELSSTDIMVTASGLLRAGNLAVFELGMWQSWTGR